ncbi:MAG: 3-hydroxyacyl-CoA dehydrogenase family protein [Chloroflexota bacterium]
MQHALQIAVLGTGQMGPGIAARLALAGHQVILYGRSRASIERGLAGAQHVLALLRDGQVVSPDAADTARARLSATTSLAEAVRPARIVFESVVEDVAVKAALFAEVERHTGADTIIASNTSGLPITQIVAQMQLRGRGLTSHFWNPGYLMPLVEIVRSQWSTDAAVEQLRGVLQAAGWAPVVLTKDVPGQLGNRLQHAVYREAFHILAEGIASVEDIDLAIKNGPGLRWPVYGLFEHADMIGLDMQHAIDSYLFADLGAAQTSPPVLTERVERGDLGVKSGRGFYDWSSKDAAEVRTVRDQFLLARLKDQLAASSTGQ